MAKKVRKKKKKAAVKPAALPQPKDFLDMTAPAAVKFNTDYAIVGGVYRSFMALRGYPATTESLALLRHLGERSGVNLTIYTRQVTAVEEKQIIQNASSKNRMTLSSSNDLRQNVTARANLQDVEDMVTTMERDHEPLHHCAVFIGLTAKDLESLRTLRDQVTAELIRAKLSADPLLLRQREGFMASNPVGFNAFGAHYERVLPASSVPLQLLRQDRSPRLLRGPGPLWLQHHRGSGPPRRGQDHRQRPHSGQLRPGQELSAEAPAV